jgi:hypothetical protein
MEADDHGRSRSKMVPDPRWCQYTAVGSRSHPCWQVSTGTWHVSVPLFRLLELRWTDAGRRDTRTCPRIVVPSAKVKLPSSSRSSGLEQPRPPSAQLCRVLRGLCRRHAAADAPGHGAGGPTGNRGGDYRGARATSSATAGHPTTSRGPELHQASPGSVLSPLRPRQVFKGYAAGYNPETY